MDISLYFRNIFETAAPKRTKKFKNHIFSILAIVDYRNWLGTSPPLNEFQGIEAYRNLGLHFVVESLNSL